MPFREKMPVKKRRDVFTGRELEGRESCLPFNRKRIDIMELDSFMGGG